VHYLLTILKAEVIMSLKKLLIFAGGIAVGAAAALLLAPTSGAELRSKIIELLKSKGISKERFDELVALITDRVKSFTTVNDLEIIVDEVLAEEGEVEQNAKQ
jgi:gas vesicle protein